MFKNEITHINRYQTIVFTFIIFFFMLKTCYFGKNILIVFLNFHYSGRAIINPRTYLVLSKCIEFFETTIFLFQTSSSTLSRDSFILLLLLLLLLF